MRTRMHTRAHAHTQRHAGLRAGAPACVHLRLLLHLLQVIASPPQPLAQLLRGCHGCRRSGPLCRVVVGRQLGQLGVRSCLRTRTRAHT